MIVLLENLMIIRVWFTGFSVLYFVCLSLVGVPIPWHLQGVPVTSLFGHESEAVLSVCLRSARRMCRLSMGLKV